MKKYIARFILFMVYVTIFWIGPLFLTKFSYMARVGICHGIIMVIAIMAWALWNCGVSIFKRKDR